MFLDPPPINFAGMDLDTRRRAANRNRAKAVVVRFRNRFVNVDDPRLIVALVDSGVAIAVDPADYQAARRALLTPAPA
jgi:hypothetical protein